MGKLEEAQKLSSSNKVERDFADAHYNFGATPQQLGKLKEAKQGYTQAISIQANYPEAHNNLGMIFKNIAI